MAASSSTSTTTSLDLGIWNKGAAATVPDLSDICAFIHHRLEEIRNLPEVQSRPNIRIGLDVTSAGCDAGVRKIEDIYMVYVSLPFLMKGEEMAYEFCDPMAALLRATYPFLDIFGKRKFDAFINMSLNPVYLEKAKKFILFHEFMHVTAGDCESYAKDEAESVKREVHADFRAATGSEERTEGGIYFNLVHAEVFKDFIPSTTHPPALERVRYLTTHLAMQSQRLTGTQIKGFASYFGPGATDWSFLHDTCYRLQTLAITDPESSCGLLERSETGKISFKLDNLFNLIIRFPHLKVIELGSFQFSMDEDNLKVVQKKFPTIKMHASHGLLNLHLTPVELSSDSISTRHIQLPITSPLSGVSSSSSSGSPTLEATSSGSGGGTVIFPTRTMASSPLAFLDTIASPSTPASPAGTCDPLVFLDSI